MTKFMQIMPVLMLGNNVSQEIKSRYIMSAFADNPQARNIALMMQAQTAGNEDRKKTKLKEEINAKVEILTEANLEAQSDAFAELPVAKRNAAIAAAKPAMQDALSKQMALPKDDRTATALNAAFKAQLVPILKTDTAFETVVSQMEAAPTKA